MSANEVVSLVYVVENTEIATLRVNEGSDFTGPHKLPTLFNQEAMAVTDPKAYGLALARAALCDGPLRRGFQWARLLAGERRLPLQFQVQISSNAPSELHRLVWELGRGSEEHYHWGVSPEILFSRRPFCGEQLTYCQTGKPRIGVAVSGPVNLWEYGFQPLEPSSIHQKLGSFGLENHSAEWKMIQMSEPVTPEALHKFCHRECLNVLILVAHGLIHTGREVGEIVLEDPQRRCLFQTSDQFPDNFGGCPNLRLAMLLTCHSGEVVGPGPFCGVGPSLVGRGMPAVVAMQGVVDLDRAIRCAARILNGLIRNGRIDRAVSMARYEAYLKNKDHPFYFSPTLHMRPKGGTLWTVQKNQYERNQAKGPKSSSVETCSGAKVGNQIEGNKVRGVIVVSSKVARSSDITLDNIIKDNESNDLKVETSEGDFT